MRAGQKWQELCTKVTVVPSHVVASRGSTHGLGLLHLNANLSCNTVQNKEYKMPPKMSNYAITWDLDLLWSVLVNTLYWQSQEGSRIED